MQTKKNIKITFTGDIMCEKAMIEHYLKNKMNDFDDIFTYIKDFLLDSDYIIGNLETPVDDSQKYTNDFFSFNTPSSFLDSLKKLGINYLSISNNHMLDRGNRGLKNTLRSLEKKGFQIVGYYSDFSYFTRIKINDFIISLTSCTYGINFNVHYDKISKKLMKQFLFLKNPNETNTSILNALKIRWKQKLKKTFIYDLYRILRKRKKGTIQPSIIIDNCNNDWKLEADYIKKINGLLEKEKRNADLVFLYSHCGGQFNIEPGTFTEKVITLLDKSNYDGYIGSHPHIVQKHMFQCNKIAAYSLGNFLIYPNSPYLIKETLPTYGILLHLNINPECPKEYFYTFSITKCILEHGQVKVILVSDLLKKINHEEKQKLTMDCLNIYNRFMGTNKTHINIKNEYKI